MMLRILRRRKADRAERTRPPFVAPNPVTVDFEAVVFRTNVSDLPVHHRASHSAEVRNSLSGVPKSWRLELCPRKVPTQLAPLGEALGDRFGDRFRVVSVELFQWRQRTHDITGTHKVHACHPTRFGGHVCNSECGRLDATIVRMTSVMRSNTRTSRCAADRRIA